MAICSWWLPSWTVQKADFPHCRKFCQENWSRWIQPRLFTNEWDCKDVRRDFVYLLIVWIFFFTITFIILEGKRMACTCGRCLFLIKITSCILSWLLPSHSGVKGWHSIARGAILVRGKGYDHCPEWTQVWEEPLRQWLTIAPVLFPSGPLLFSHRGQNQSECLPAGEAEPKYF